MSATPLYIRGGHSNMAAVSFNYACQMRDPVNYSFQISGGDTNFKGSDASALLYISLFCGLDIIEIFKTF